MLRQGFKNAFYSFENLCIDESLLLYKDKLYLKQYISSKRNQFWTKSLIFCNIKYGFVQDFTTYNESLSTVSCENETISKLENIIMQLLKTYLNKGYTFYVDNWYTSPIPFTFLHKNGTNVCGIVKKHGKAYQ
jgi:hypothetical protein